MVNATSDTEVILVESSILSLESSSTTYAIPSSEKIISHSASATIVEKNEEVVGNGGERAPTPPDDSRSPTPRSYTDDLHWIGEPGLLLRLESMFAKGNTPAEILKTLFPRLQTSQIPAECSDEWIMDYISQFVEEPTRQKLPQYNSFNDAVELFRSKKKILILTGAGVSVSCGIPDFRSKDGIYARLHEEFPDLPDPTAMFDIRYFKHDPAPFFDFAKEIFPGQFEPSLCHKFIRELEKNRQLLRNYTQNIDTLEKQTGIERVIECHGSFSKATCLSCGAKYDGDIIREDVMAKRVAYCPTCTQGVVKPDIVFFGEDLGKQFHDQLETDRRRVDLIVVIGSSMKVRPVSLIPFSVQPDVPQILINRESLTSYKPDIELLGNCDDIVRELCYSLGGSFDRLVEEHDAMVAKKNMSKAAASTSAEATTEKRKRLRKIEGDEFDNLVEELSRSLYPIEGTDDGAPPEKKAKIDERASDESTKLIEKRFYDDWLPKGCYAQTDSHRCVFPGAEVSYDNLRRRLCTVSHHDMRRGYIISRPLNSEDGDTDYERIGDTDSDDEEDDDDEGEDLRSKAGSEPNIMDPAAFPILRSDSCEPSIDTDSLISVEDFRQTLFTHHGGSLDDDEPTSSDSSNQ